MKRLLSIALLLLLLLPLQAQRSKVYTSVKSVKNPEDVYILKLNYKRLKKIPPEVFTYTHLRELDLGRNFIDTVPPEIANLKDLEKLDLSRNWLHYLPEAMGELTQLRELDLNRNPLQELPGSMANLQNLEVLILWQSGVHELPPTFVLLDATLKSIDLRLCPLSTADHEAIEDLLPSVKKVWDHSCNCD